jgi:hypothetical protein
MTRWAAFMMLVCALALGACGKLGPPVRSVADLPAQGEQRDQGQQRDQEEQEEGER